MESRRTWVPGFLRTEDWLGFWLGLLTIAIILFGAWQVITPPYMKWAADGESSAYLRQQIAAVDKAAALAKQTLPDQELQAGLAALKQGVEAGDRQAALNAAKAVDQTLKNSAEIKKAVTVDPKAKDAVNSLSKTVKDVSTVPGLTMNKIFTAKNIVWILIFAVVLLVFSALGVSLMGENPLNFAKGFPVVFLLAALSNFLAGNYTMSYYGVEYVIWAMALGLLISNVFKPPAWLLAAARPEFYIKVGLVIYGSQILFSDILKLGSLGIVQTLLVITVVWGVCFWLCRRMGVDDDFAAILSSAVSICGVSAAIAASGAIKGDPKKLSYTVSLVVLCAIPMIILQPIIARAIGLPEVVSGAWIGGTLDSTATVVAASALVGPTALKAGTVIKMTQNVLIGVAAFILAMVWSFRKTSGVARPGIGEIWRRFPKFVLGFVIASLVFSFAVPPALISSTSGALGAFRLWWFTMAFVSIGLSTQFREVANLGSGRPALAFLGAQAFNIIWTLLLAYLLFGGVFFAAPKL